MKKTLSFVLALTMVLTLLPIAALAASYKDTETAWGSDAIERWTGEGVVNGKADNNFDPNGPLKRAEAAMIYSRLLKLEDKSELTFPDVPENAWYADAIARNVAAGIFGGTDIGMEPEKAITREAMIVTLARVLGVPSEETCNKEFTDYEETSAWARGAVNAMVNMGVIGGVSADELAPKADVSRQQAVVMLDRLITAYITEDGTRTIAGAEGRYTLLVAKNVSLTGPYNGTPVVIYAKNGKVSMGTVTGTATYYVMVSGVAVTGAAPGTTFVVGPNATGLTVNGVPVGPNSTYVVPYYSYNPPVIPTEYTFTLKYDANAPEGVTVTGKMDDQTATSTTNAAYTFEVAANNFVAEGYKFNGWNTAANGSGDPYSAGNDIAVQPNSTVTLYAQWVKEAEPVTYTYKLVYDKNAPEGVTVTGTIDDDTATSTTDAPHTFTVTDKEYAADGYNFTGWKDSKGTSYAAQDTIDVEPNSTVTLYAQWEKKIVYHTVTYTDAAGKTLTSETLPEGSTHTVLSDAAAGLKFDDNEQKFAGWLDSAAGNVYTAGMTITVTTDVTLKAQLVDLKDLIGLAVSSALGYVSEKAAAKDDLLSKDGEYNFKFISAGYEQPATKDPGKTRNGKIAGSASVEEGVVVHAITWASHQAIKLLGGTPTGEEVGSVVDTVIDQLGDAGIDVDPVEGNRDKLKAIKDAVLAEAKEQARIILEMFKADGSYVFRTVKVTVGGHTVELDPLTKRPTEGTRREKAIELATAFAREVYSSLKKYNTAYVDVVDITVPVKVEFTASDNTAISMKTNEYAYKYDFTLEAKLNSNGMVYFKYDNVNDYGHVVYTVGDDTRDSYEKNIANIVDATLDSKEFQANIGEAVNESVAKFTEGGVFAKLKDLLAREDLKIDPAKVDIDGALTKWMTDNNLTADKFGDSPLFDELWNGNTAVYNNEAIYGLIEEVGAAVGEGVTNMLLEKLGDSGVGHGIFRYVASVVGPKNLKEMLDKQGIEFDTGLGDDYENVDKYILAKICDAIVAKAEEDPNFGGRDLDDEEYEEYDTEAIFADAKADIDNLVKKELGTVMDDYKFFETLAKFKTIDTAKTITLGELQGLLNDPTLRDIVPQSVTNRVPRLKNALNRIPEGYTVTVTTDDGVEHTLTSAEIKALKEAASLTEALNDFVNDTNKDLTLGKFDVKDGLKVTLTRETNGTRTFVFYLWLDLDGSKEFLK